MPADVTSVPVEFLFTMVANLSAPMVAGAGPKGTRVIIGVTGGSVKGPRSTASCCPRAVTGSTPAPTVRSPSTCGR